MWMVWVALGLCLLLAIYVSTRYAWWRQPTDWRYPRVLMYHMCRGHVPKARFNKLRVRPNEFRKQLAWLKDQGFTFVFLSDLLAGEPTAPRTVCLTFDDGYLDNLLEADPIMAEYGAVATLYLVEDRSAGWSSKKKVHHADDELANEPKLSDAQVAQMIASGRWELGGHTTTHANLVKISDDEAFDEIGSARQCFASQFGVEVKSFAYPFGIFNDRHVELVRQAGYLGAVTTDTGIEAHPFADPMRLPRVKVSGKEGMMGFVMRMRGGKRGLNK